MKNTKTVSVIKNTLIIFAITVLYCVLKHFDMSEAELYSLFLGDFSIGICSRFLIGSIISIFKDVITREWLVSFLRFSTFCVFLLTAHYLGSTLTSTGKEKRTSLMFFCAMFIACPFSITIFAGDIFGFIDVFCMLIVLMTAYFCQSRILMLSIPVLMIAGIFIHDSFITGYMAPCFGILAYYVIKKYGRKLYTSAIFIFSAVISVLTCVYTVFFSRKTIKMSTDEVLAYLAKKGNTTVADVSGYIEDIVMLEDIGGVAPADVEKTPMNNIYYMIKIAIEDIGVDDIIYFILIIPIIALIFYIWIKAIKNCNTFNEKIPYILFMLTPVPQILSLMMSNDFTRFLSTILITQTIYIFITVREKDNTTGDVLRLFSEQPQMFIMPCTCVLLANII